jgi:hypothetical protein
MNSDSTKNNFIGFLRVDTPNFLRVDTPNNSNNSNIIYGLFRNFPSRYNYLTIGRIDGGLPENSIKNPPEIKKVSGTINYDYFLIFRARKLGGRFNNS